MSETIQKDAQNAQAEKNDGAQTAQGAAADKTLFDPEVQLQKFSRGKIRLATPILASDKDVTELIYDFAALTGRELVAALDKGGAAKADPAQTRRSIEEIRNPAQRVMARAANISLYQ